MINYDSMPINGIIKTWQTSSIKQMMSSASRLYTHSDWNAPFKTVKKMVNHALKPFGFVSKMMEHQETKTAVRTFFNSLNQKASDVHDMTSDAIEHYSGVRFQYRTDTSLSRNGVGFFQDIVHQDWKKSRNYNVRRQAMMIGTGNGRSDMRSFTNYANPARNLSLINPIHVYNGLASATTWLFHLDNQFNESGCLGRGFWWLPENNTFCNPPIFTAPTETRLYPIGFDPWHPGCEAYLDPIIYARSFFYVVSHYSTLDLWIEEHDGLKEIGIFKWAIYNIASTNHTLPPNTIPCVLWAPVSWFIEGAIGFGLFFALGLVLKLVVSVQKAVFKDDDEAYLTRIPDITKLIPPPQVTVNKINSALDALAAGNLQHLTMLDTDYASDQIGRLEQLSDKVSQKFGKIGTSGGSKIPKLNLPKVNIPKISLPKFSMPSIPK